MSIGAWDVPLNLFIGMAALFGIFSLLFVVQFLRETFSRYYYSHRGFFGKLMLLLGALILAAMGAASASIGFLVAGYHAFALNEKAAEVRARAVTLPDGPGIEMVFTLFDKGRPTPARRFLLHGEEWAVDGDFLRWKDTLAFLGLRPGYRVTRVTGRYLTAAEEERMPRTARAVAVEETDPLWVWLYRYGRYVPFVQAAYGSTVYSLPQPNQVVDVLVTPSGFSMTSHAP